MPQQLALEERRALQHIETNITKRYKMIQNEGKKQNTNVQSDVLNWFTLTSGTSLLQNMMFLPWKESCMILHHSSTWHKAKPEPKKQSIEAPIVRMNDWRVRSPQGVQCTHCVKTQDHNNPGPRRWQ